MSRLPESPLPPELREALRSKPPVERDRILRVWELLGAIDDYKGDITTTVPDTETALKALEQTLDAEPTSQIPSFAADRPARSSATDRRWIAAGVSLGLLLFAVLVALWWRQPVVIVAAPSEQVAVRLPDGSRVELNSGSRLEYNRRFESWPGIEIPERRVHLEGEAYFDVTKGSRPFIVYSFNARVRVTGTTFNVRARSDELRRETQVTLSSGRVEVIPQSRPDQMVVLSEAGHTTRIVDNDPADSSSVSTARLVSLNRALAWRTKAFAAVDMPLASVFAEIERRFALTIQVDSTIDVLRSINVFMDDQPEAVEIIQDICLSQGCRYRKDNGGFIIFPEEATP